ncbi:hypothetical protein [Dysgonomonas sp. ZJ709]|uniref:hypothetical protein n=1 Tax=Dysgonomonas sp. ZJ709 TaxID=2709797 RepID=UPI002104211C|nr:hypothetical protein [Dysgonomonas sp. ZJ709]
MNEGAINFPTFEVGGWRWARYVYSGLFDNDKKLKDYSKEEWHNLIYAKMKLKNQDEKYPKSGDYEGILPRFKRTFLKKDSRDITGKNAIRFKEVVTQGVCPECKGGRLNPTILSCKIREKNIAACCAMQIDELHDFIKDIHEPSIEPLTDATIKQLDGLLAIGLAYLSLDRETSTLSGGESQRVKLIRHLGSSLTDLTYVFDEPSVGLHTSDVHKLNELLIKLRDKGNTVLIVEHDPDVIAIADYIVDMGIGAGRDRGNIVYCGDLAGLKASKTLTEAYLSTKLEMKNLYRKRNGVSLSLSDITLHNLRSVSVEIPPTYNDRDNGSCRVGKKFPDSGINKEIC